MREIHETARQKRKEIAKRINDLVKKNHLSESEKNEIKALRNQYADNLKGG